MPAILQDQLLYAQPLDSHTVGVDGASSSGLSWKHSSSFLTDESHSIKDHAKSPMVASFDEVLVKMPNGRGQRLAWQKASSFLSPVVADTEEQSYIPKRLSASTSFFEREDTTESSARTYDLKRWCLSDEKCKEAVKSWCHDKKPKPHLSECIMGTEEEGKLWEEYKNDDEKLQAKWEVWSNRQFNKNFLLCSHREGLYHDNGASRKDIEWGGMPNRSEWEDISQDGEKLLALKNNWKWWPYKDSCKYSYSSDGNTPCVKTFLGGFTYCDRNNCVDTGTETRCQKLDDKVGKFERH